MLLRELNFTKIALNSLFLLQYYHGMNYKLKH